MKELKNIVTNELSTGFNEINNLLNVFKFYIETQANKQKDELIDDFILMQMRALESQVILQLRKITDNLIKTHLEWKSKVEET